MYAWLRKEHLYIMLLVTFLYYDVVSECKRKLAACMLKQCTSVSLCPPFTHSFSYFFKKNHFISRSTCSETIFHHFMIIFTIYAAFALLDVSLGNVYLTEMCSCSLASHTLRTQHALHPDRTPGHPHEFSKHSRRLSRCLPGRTVGAIVISLWK